MKQIQEKKQIRITDYRMTRFFMTQEEVAELIIQAAEKGRGGEIFVTAMPAFKILDLAEVMVDLLGKPNVDIVESGIRPGEKIHELLISEYESQHAVQIGERCIAILPQIESPELKETYSAFPPIAAKTFSSSDVLISKDEIKRMLMKGACFNLKKWEC